MKCAKLQLQVSVNVVLDLSGSNKATWVLLEAVLEVVAVLKEHVNVVPIVFGMRVVLAALIDLREALIASN